MDDLDILPPEPVRLTIAERQIEIGPLRMRQWRPMTTALGGEAMAAILSGDLRKALQHEDAVAKAIVIATDKAVDEAWLADLYPSQFLRLFRVVAEVNRDFFDQAVMPEIVALMRAFIRVAAPTAAQTPPAPSPGSSPGGTATETSST